MARMFDSVKNEMEMNVDDIKRKYEMMYVLFVKAWRGGNMLDEVYRCQISIWLDDNQSNCRIHSLKICR